MAALHFWRSMWTISYSVAPLTPNLHWSWTTLVISMGSRTRVTQIHPGHPDILRHKRHLCWATHLPEVVPAWFGTSACRPLYECLSEVAEELPDPHLTARMEHTAKLEEQHHEALEADSTSGMGWRAEAERVDVRLHLLRVDPDCLHALFEKRRVVQPLGATEDLLAAHEEVVRV